jgi:hypothetical protein
MLLENYVEIQPSAILALLVLHDTAQQHTCLEPPCIQELHATYHMWHSIGAEHPVIPDFVFKPDFSTIELNICRPEGVDVTTLIISRTLVIALGMIFKPC